jgi:hypothetical protein
MPTPVAALQAAYLANLFAALTRTVESPLQSTFATLEAQLGAGDAADVAAAQVTLAALLAQTDKHTPDLQGDIELANAKAAELAASIAAGI